MSMEMRSLVEAGKVLSGPGQPVTLKARQGLMACRVANVEHDNYILTWAQMRKSGTSRKTSVPSS